MSELDAFKLCNYCPECGTKLNEVDGIKRCKNHPMSLFLMLNAQGIQVMAYDPNRARQIQKRGG